MLPNDMTTQSMKSYISENLSVEYRLLSAAEKSSCYYCTGCFNRTDDSHFKSFGANKPTVKTSRSAISFSANNFRTNSLVKLPFKLDTPKSLQLNILIINDHLSIKYEIPIQI